MSTTNAVKKTGCKIETMKERDFKDTKQCRYDVTTRRIRATIFAVEK
jgi:hypothetical protein